VLVCAQEEGRPEFLSPEAKQRENVAQIHQSLGLAPFGGGQRRSPILFVQERLEAALDSLGKPKSRQIARHLELNLNGSSHATKPNLCPVQEQ
jgi:hypothetical protein